MVPWHADWKGWVLGRDETIYIGSGMETQPQERSCDACMCSENVQLCIPVSAGTASAWPPELVISLTNGAKPSSLRETSATLNPSRANFLAMPAPAPAKARDAVKDLW